MREILFRGKRLSDGGWSYGNLRIANTGVTIIVPNDTPLGKYGKVDPEAVGQFTGLTDKNGVKIFEGDVVDILTENEEIGVVKYEDGGFLVSADGFCVDFHSNINGTDLEVIGNIFDNPELVKGGEADETD